MERVGRRVALVTGSSRGIGAAAALALADRGYDIAISYRNKAARAQAVADRLVERGVRALTVEADLTGESDLIRLVHRVRDWAEWLDALVLNASGGLERDLVAADATYPRRINRDAQLALLDACIPLLHPESTVVFVTSHWAHLYGQVAQIPAYEPVAASKWAGEQALRARQPELLDRGVRLIVVTGDLIEGTITPKLLERSAPGTMSARKSVLGELPSAETMGEEIAAAIVDRRLPTGYTVVVGGELRSLR